MKLIKNPDPATWQSLIARPENPAEDTAAAVEEIFADVQEHGDRAVRKYTKLYDQAALKSLLVQPRQWKAAESEVSQDLKKAIDLAQGNIERFHRAQAEPKKIVETTPGVFCWRESRPIPRVGIYVPGGSAPLFSTVLMLGIPARLAGCKEIVLCTPPDPSGQIHPAILYAAQKVGITQVYTIGGIQAIAAMTFGTQSVPKVDKIFGPGNQFVTAAKLMAQYYGVPIDMPAGPSELLIIADHTANPAYAAADLLSQAEHGQDSQVILLSHREYVLESILAEVKRQTPSLPRHQTIKQSLVNSSAILLESVEQCIAFSNLYAPEHLILAIENPKKHIPAIEHAGSVFLGNYSCESAGDYASGPNHTLPTNGNARNHSGVSLDSFVNKITFQELGTLGLQRIGPAIEIMAEAEQLHAHKNAVSIRLNDLRR